MPQPDPNANIPPEPVWDGEGKDPWLPARLSALLDASTAEQLTHEAIWDALSAWLVETTRRIFTGPFIDPTAILAQAPAWQKYVAEFITGTIMPIMSWAYENIFGNDYKWQDRPNVIAYLISVSNRLVGIPEEVFGLVSGQIAAGVTLGEGIPELTQRVDAVLSTTKSARWPNRAVVIARTEALGALNGSRADSFQAFEEEGGEGMERMWLSTQDSRTRESHVIADGQRVGVTQPFIVGGFPLMFPGDPTGPPQETIQCRCSLLLLEIGENVNMTNRQLNRR
jgi:hypothetical protein